MAKKVIQSIATIPNGSIKVDPKAVELKERIALPAKTPTQTPAVSPLPTPTPQPTTIKGFGSESNLIERYPNDAIILDVRNAVNVFLESNYRVNTYIQEGNDITVDVEQDIKDLGYTSGKYLVEYKFHRNYLGSGDGHRVEIQEISSDGLEARITASPSNTLDNSDFLSFFAAGLFALPKAQTLSNLFLFKSTDTGVESYRVFDYVQDRFTLSINPYSIVLKFSTPLPTTVAIGDRIWIAQQLNDPIVDTITMVPPKPKRNQTRIAGPNWDVLNKTQTTVTTPYKDWDDILTTNTQTTEGIINSLLSGSLIEGVNLNVDYRRFSNHIVLGSAVERLENFKYKLTLLENYNEKIADLSTNLTGLAGSAVTGSAAFQANVINLQTKRAALLGSFDSYEKYLFNQSSSYESSSYGEFYPSTWPKQNSSKPYINHSVTSSQAEDWYSGIYTSASLYDNNNGQALYKLIPAHVLENESNDQYTLFVSMMGHYFDIMLLYIKQISETTNRNQSIYEGFSKDLIYHVAKNLGVDFENGNVLEELWAYTLGTDSTGSLASSFDSTSDERTKEIWKRIINNLPFLLKTKGTERGVRALINCYGIPQTILRIREYGGAEPEFDSKTDLQYERFFYALKVGPNEATGNLQQISAPWTTLTQNQLTPMSVEIRAKMAGNVTGSRILLESANRWKIEAFESGSGTHLGFFLKNASSNVWATASVSCSIYDNKFHQIALIRSAETDATSTTQTYTLIDKSVNYDKVTTTFTASLVVDGATSSSYNQSFVTASTLFVGATNGNVYSSWSGSIQELRYWTKPLQNSILDNHTLAPTSYQGNLEDAYTGSTSSFYDLGFRMCLGSDNKRVNLSATSSIRSQHPDQFKTTFFTGEVAQATFINYSVAATSSYEPITEKHSLEWPDLGGNRSVGTKIRIESTTTAGVGGAPELWRDNSVQRSLSDAQPPDSSRLGVYLSPQNEINQDIAEQFGGISIDDYIGDPSYLSLDTYPGLDRLKWEYSRKFSLGRNNPQNYIRLLKHYDASLFQLIKKFVPYRANTQVGLVIEPTIIERAKARTTIPSFEELQYSASIDVGPEAIWTPGGAIQDGDGEPFRNQLGSFNNGYVPEGTIGGDESDYIRLSGEEQRVAEYNDIISYPTYDYQAPRQNIDMIPDFNSPAVSYVVLDGTEVELSPTFEESRANEFNNLGLDDNPSTPVSMTGEVDLGVSQYGRDTRVLGSQYAFMTWATSGSGATVSAPYMITSSHYSYHEALNPTIITGRYSERSNNADDVYGLNVFGGRAFSGSRALESNLTIFTSSAAFQDNLWTSQYGMHIRSAFTQSGFFYGTALYGSSYYGVGSNPISSTGNYHWRMSSGSGLYFINNSGASASAYSGSVSFDAFYYKPTENQTRDYLYDVSVTLTSVNTTCNLVLGFGGFATQYTQSIAVPSFPTETTYTYRTRADGNQLTLLLKVSSASNGGAVFIKNLSAKSINYRAEVQDFHLQDSYGMRNARYDGCKMTSTDYNVDSLDTVDGGPVITITVGGGTEFASVPTTRGNFQIR